MTTLPVLHLPDFSKPFAIDTNISGVAIGAVLSQDSHPLAFFSKKLNSKMQVASVYVREMYTVTEAVKVTHFHRSKEPQKFAFTENSDSRTTKMGFKDTRL